jgi:hypothetical protein
MATTTTTSTSPAPPPALARTFITSHRADFVIATEAEAQQWIAEARAASTRLNWERFLTLKLLLPLESADLRIEGFAGVDAILSKIERFHVGMFLRQLDSQQQEHA